MNRIFVAMDGSWGDADTLMIVEVTEDELADLVDNDRSDTEMIEFAAAKKNLAHAPLAELDGTDDAADWLVPGHVLDEDEVEFLRNR